MPQSNTQSKEIGGKRYTVMMLDPLDAEDLLVTVINVIGPSLGVAAGAVADASKNGGGGELLSESIAPEAFEKAIGGFCERVSREQVREVIAILTPVTTVEISGKTPRLDSIFSEHFRGKIGKLNEWLVFAIKVQLSDFFDYAGSGIGAGLQLVRDAASPSPSSRDTTDEPPE